MAKLATLPSQDIIDGLKGKVDFYLWNGIVCARKWPRSPGHARAPAVQETWSAFSYAAKSWDKLPIEAQEAYAKMAEGTGLSSRDLFMRSYLSGLYRYPLP